MFDIGWTEMALVAVVALFVVGPKELPHLLYKLAGYWKKVRGMAREFQSGLDDIIREAELDDLRKQVSSAQTSATDFIDKNIAPPKPEDHKNKAAKTADKPADGAAVAKSSTASETSASVKKESGAEASKAPAPKSAAPTQNDHPESQA